MSFLRVHHNASVFPSIFIFLTCTAALLLAHCSVCEPWRFFFKGFSLLTRLFTVLEIKSQLLKNHMPIILALKYKLFHQINTIYLILCQKVLASWEFIGNMYLHVNKWSTFVAEVSENSRSRELSTRVSFICSRSTTRNDFLKSRSRLET